MPPAFNSDLIESICSLVRATLMLILLITFIFVLVSVVYLCYFVCNNYANVRTNVRKNKRTTVKKCKHTNVDIAEEVHIALKRKFKSIEKAADALEISRTTLYQKIATVEKDRDFQQLIEEKAGINIHNLVKGGSMNPDVPEMQIDNIKMNYNVVNLKANRKAIVWLPSDFSKTDVRTFESWLKLIESTL